MSAQSLQDVDSVCGERLVHCIMKPFFQGFLLSLSPAYAGKGANARLYLE